MKTYASLDAFKHVLGMDVPETPPAEPTASDNRLALALVTATAWVDRRIGEDLDPTGWTGDASDLEVEDDPDPTFVSATLVAAVRFWKSPDVPFGVAGGLGDMAVHVSRRIPEAELLLNDYRLGFSADSAD